MHIRMNYFRGIPLLVGTFLFLSCSTTMVRQQEAVLDDPVHHSQRGTEAMHAGRWEEARRSFQLALELDPKFPPALAGKAVVVAKESTSPGRSEQQRNELSKEATELLKKASDEASELKHQVNVHTRAIWVWTLLQPKDWLEKAEYEYEDAVRIQEKTPELSTYRAEPHFYMGEAYKQALQLEKAIDQYRSVLELNGSFLKEANAALSLLDKILRAQPGSLHGKQVALVERIHRSDMAALLIEELDLPALYQRRSVPKKALGYQGPNLDFVPPAERPQAVQLATDIENHPLRDDIEDVLKLGVRGLEASPQYLFYPNQEVTRAEFVLMLEDILIQVTQDPMIATQFVGESSPWIDVREDVFYYNAARSIVSRGIMGIWNSTRAEFGPDQPIHGADALLGIRVFKEELQSYVKSLKN